MPKKISKKTPPPIRSWSFYLSEEKENYKKRSGGDTLPKVSTNDFIFVKTLGQGAFGRVMLVQHKTTGNAYACKIMRKEFIVQQGQVQVAFNEKQILNSIRCPFTVHLDYFFQDTTFLYYFLPLVEGGELFTYLRKEKKFSEPVSKFFAAQVVLALEYLHYLDLIYRDLKPENLLIDRTGYIRVTDFGLSKKVVARTYTLCGTPEYIAPEVLLPQGYGKSADWWSFGVLLYEFNCGKTPFVDPSQVKIYEKIVKGSYKTPDFFSKDLKDMIKSLLQTNVTKRIGNLKAGVNDIKDHKWFRQVFWIALINKSVRSPYLPKIKPPKKRKEEPLVALPYDLYKSEFAYF